MPCSRTKRSGSRPPSRVTIFTSKSSSVSMAMDVAAFFVLGVERACGEGDHLACLVRNGERDALAEARIHRAGRAVGLLLGAEQAAGAKGVFGEVRAQGIAHGVEVIRRIPDAKG